MTEDQDTRRDYYVYAYYRDGDPIYIGKGRGDRWLKHMNKARNRHLRALLDKDRAENSTRITRGKIADNLGEAEAYALEIQMIEQFGRRPAGFLVNLTKGGEGGSDGKALVGRRLSQVTKDRISASKFGRKLSREHIDKLARLSRSRMADDEYRKRSVSNLVHIGRSSGFAHSNETRRKMSNAAAGRKPVDSPEIREKRARSMIGKKFPNRKLRGPHSKQTKAKMSEAARRIGPKSAVTREKLRAALVGRARSLEAVAKMVATNAAKRAFQVTI